MVDGWTGRAMVLEIDIAWRHRESRAAICFIAMAFWDRENV